MQFDLAFVQNVQAQYAQTSEATIKLGLGAVGLETGSKMIYFIYDKVRTFWEPRDMELVDTDQIIAVAHNQAQQEVQQQWMCPSTSNERRSAFGTFANTACQLGDAMDVVQDTPEFAQQPQQQQQQQVIPQPQRPLPPTVALQKQRIEIGQQMVPVNDHNDNDHDDDDDHNTTKGEKVPDQTDHLV